MKLVADSERALIQGLQGEKKHLEMNLEENMQLKEQFQKKCRFQFPVVSMPILKS